MVGIGGLGGGGEEARQERVEGWEDVEGRGGWQRRRACGRGGRGGGRGHVEGRVVGGWLGGRGAGHLRWQGEVVLRQAGRDVWTGRTRDALGGDWDSWKAAWSWYLGSERN